jgi:hypothetical protein
VTYDTTFAPNEANRAYYDDKFARYRKLYETLREFNAGYSPA